MSNNHFYSLVLVVFLFSRVLYGQTSQCDPLRPVQGSESQYKDRGNRCEGLYIADIGVPNIEILSLTTGEISYSLAIGEQILVSAPGVPGTVHVRAVAKPPRTYYQMDALLASGATLKWPVEDVLLPEKIGANRIGVYAFRTESNHRIFVPVRIVANSVGQTRRSEVQTILVIRPSFDADSIKWRWSILNQGSCSRFGDWQNAAANSVDAGQSVDVFLAGLKGPTCVEVAARIRSQDDWSTLKLYIEMTGS
jgi:hypothetical protein